MFNMFCRLRCTVSPVTLKCNVSPVRLRCTCTVSPGVEVYCISWRLRCLVCPVS
jgi:hypothetical protein